MTRLIATAAAVLVLIGSTWPTTPSLVNAQAVPTAQDEEQRSLDEIIPQTLECTADLAHAKLVGVLVSLGDSLINDDVAGALATISGLDPPYVSCVEAAVNAVEPGQLPALNDCLTEPGQVGALCRQLLSQRVQELLAPISRPSSPNSPGQPAPGPAPVAIGASPSVPDGGFLKGDGPDIYVMHSGLKHLLPDWETFLSQGGQADLSNVLAFGDPDLAGVPDGDPVASVKPVQQPSQSQPIAVSQPNSAPSLNQDPASVALQRWLGLLNSRVTQTEMQNQYISQDSWQKFTITQIDGSPTSVPTGQPVPAPTAGVIIRTYWEEMFGTRASAGEVEVRNITATVSEQKNLTAADQANGKTWDGVITVAFISRHRGTVAVGRGVPSPDLSRPFSSWKDEQRNFYVTQTNATWLVNRPPWANRDIWYFPVENEPELFACSANPCSFP